MSQESPGVSFRCGWLLLWKAVLRFIVGFGLTICVAALKVWAFAFVLGILTFVWSGIYVFAHARSKLICEGDELTVLRSWRSAERYSLATAKGRLVKVWWNAGGRVLEVFDGARSVKVPGVAVIPWGNARLIGPRVTQVSAELEQFGLRMTE